LVLATLRALHAIEFDKLPPSATWESVVDDVGILSVTSELDQKRSEFSIFYPPSLWPSLPGATRDAIEEVVAILEPIARKLHKR
jgi:hypothetical protein